MFLSFIVNSAYRWLSGLLVNLTIVTIVGARILQKLILANGRKCMKKNTELNT
nr:MAG TPA: hypothetical protein [Bacteriophage sp.]